jgi:hypothetical protein
LNADNFANFATEKAITAALDSKEAASFAVTFRAEKAGQLSSMLAVSSRLTPAMAFENEQKLDVAISFRNGSTTTIAGVGFEVYQNTPNPVSEFTNISFNLTEASAASIIISDMQGRTIKTINGNYPKGLNTVLVNRADLATGVLFYQVSAAGKSATMKMVVID